jgi:hypothetical protein
MVERRRGGQNAAHLAGGQDHREFELRIGTGQFQFGWPSAAKRFLPKYFNRADRLGAGLACYLFVLLEMDAILAEVFGREQVGRFAIVLAELADARGVGLLGARADGQELEVIGEGF